MNEKYDGYHEMIGVHEVTYIKDDDEDEFFEIIESDNSYYIFNYFKKCERIYSHVLENYEEMIYEFIPKYLKEF